MYILVFIIKESSIYLLNTILSNDIYCQGYVSWSDMKKSQISFRPPFLKYFYDLQEDPWEHIIDASILYSNSFQIQSIVQSYLKPPLWLCTNFDRLTQISLNKKRIDFSKSIQLDCNSEDIKSIERNCFDFTIFCQAVKMNNSHCKYKIDK